MARLHGIKHLFFGAQLVLTTIPPIRAQSAAKLKIQIVPESYSTNASRDANIKCSHFHVLLTNKSSVSIGLFEEWNSSGYFCLSFAITYPDGRTVSVVKMPRGWDKNFPSTLTIEPGGFHVFDVDLDPKIWLESPLQERGTPGRPPWPADGLHCRMRAIFSISPREASEAIWLPEGVSVWTGTITSAERTYQLWQ